MINFEEKKEKILPVVISEPSLGVERAMLVFLFDSYFIYFYTIC
jgi:glycyl-tRNA synthetase (class II)